MTMAIQRRAAAADSPTPSEADSYERATSFLSSLLFSTAEATHKPHYDRPFSPSVPDLPLPSGTLRRRSAFSNDGGSGNNNDAAINSLVHSLRTSLMFHEQHQNQNRPSMSPSCLGAVLFEESTSGVGAGGIPPLPLPFSARPTAMQQPTLARDHQQGLAPTVRSAAAAPSVRSRRGSHNVPCSSIRRSSSGSERRRNDEDITAKPQCKDVSHLGPEAIV